METQKIVPQGTYRFDLNPSERVEVSCSDRCRWTVKTKFTDQVIRTGFLNCSTYKLSTPEDDLLYVLEIETIGNVVSDLYIYRW